MTATSPAGITDVPGVRVGHWTDLEARTGCTVVVFPEPNVATVEVRGAAPGTRETDLLRPGMRVEQIQAILLTGGSAFGLAAADGVVRQLAAEGRGHPTPAGPVPIVPAAVIFDLMVGNPAVRPGPEEGAAAYRVAGASAVTSGRVGAGAGATVAKWRGFEQARDGGLGTAALVVGDHTVGALVVVNGVGDVFTLEGEALTGGPGFSAAAPSVRPLENTTLAVVAVDAALGRSELTRLAVRAQDAIGACLRPAHTRFDGDAAFAVACGSAVGDPDVLAEAAFETVGRAIAAAVRG